MNSMATLYNGYQADHGEATCLTVLAQVMIEGQLTPVSQSGDGMPRWAMTKPWHMPSCASNVAMYMQCGHTLLSKQCAFSGHGLLGMCNHGALIEGQHRPTRKKRPAKFFFVWFPLSLDASSGSVLRDLFPHR